MTVQEIDRVDLAFQLSCYVRAVEGAWVSGCPALDVVTQAESKEAAKAAIEEAVEMWVESCIERETLGEALRELGWRPGPAAMNLGWRRSASLDGPA